MPIDDSISDLNANDENYNESRNNNSDVVESILSTEPDNEKENAIEHDIKKHCDGKNLL